jgi:hypothetical protein
MISNNLGYLLLDSMVLVRPRLEGRGCIQALMLSKVDTVMTDSSLRALTLSDSPKAVFDKENGLFS